MTQGPGMAMVASVFPAHERGKALGTHMSVVGAGAIAGPAMGGLLISVLGWEWVFFISVPLSVVSIVTALVILEKAPPLHNAEGVRIDWPGWVLSAGALVALLMALTMGPRMGWGSPTVVTAALGFGALLAAFIWWELRIPAPMLDLTIFKRKLLSLSVSAGFISFMGAGAVSFLLMPLYLQAVLGYGPGMVGLILAPNALAMIVMGPLSGRLSDRYGWRKFNMAGLTVSAAGLFVLSTVTESSPLGLVMTGLILVNCGMGIFNSPNNNAILSSVERSRYGVVSALTQLVRNSATVTSVAIGTAIVTATMASMGHPPSLAAVSDATDRGIFEAFTAGIRMVSYAMGSLVLVGVVLSYLKGPQPKVAPAPMVLEPQVDRSQAD